MGVIRGGGEMCDSDDSWKKDAIKVFFLYDLIFFATVGVFVCLYIYLAPFSGAFIGAVSFITIAVLSDVVFILINIIGNKYKWYVFSRYKYFYKTKGQISDHVMKVYVTNMTILIICFFSVWYIALSYASTNIYWAEFKPNVITWLDQGKCDEIKKYDDGAANFCSYVVKAKENIKGVFIVESMRLTNDATGCTYLVNSDKSDMYFLTTKTQLCDVAVGQKVNIVLKSFVFQSSLFEGNDEYSYSLQVTPVK